MNAGRHHPRASGLRPAPAGLALTPPLRLPQSLQNSSYNHFAAIYYLLLERLKEYRHTQPSARPGPARQQRPRSSDLSGFEVGEQCPSELCLGLHPPPPLPQLQIPRSEGLGGGRTAAPRSRPLPR